MTDPKQLDGEVIEDARTGEIIPLGELPKTQSNTLATILDLTKVGTLVLDEKAEAVLAEPIKPEEVSIRPDGLVYLPWTWYADRLNRAFGRLGWGLVPQAGPQTRDMGNKVLVVWGHWLVIRGIPVGFEIGETTYQPDNYTMSFGDAAAGAKSSSLARNCKMLGMSLELWNPEWIGEWKKEYAESYPNPKQGARPATLWRKKSKKIVQPAAEIKATTEKTPVGTTDEPVVKTYTLKELKTVGNVKQLATDADMKNSEVAIALGKMDNDSVFHWTEIVEKLMEGK